MLHGAMSFFVGLQRLQIGVDLLPLAPCNDALEDAAELRRRLDTAGYLYIRHAVPAGIVSTAFSAVSKQIMELKPAALSSFALTSNISAAICGSHIAAIVRHVLGGPVRCLPLQSLELHAPGETHGFHMDAVYLNRGSKLTLTAWTPLHSVPLGKGGLAIVEGSNSAAAYEKIRATYGVHDVEKDGIRGDGSFTLHPHSLPCTIGTIFEPPKNPVMTTTFQAGDVVLLTLQTMHGFVTNTSLEWCMSGESRWLLEDDPVGPDPRYVGNPPVGLGDWVSSRESADRFPVTMPEAKRRWGVG